MFLAAPERISPYAIDFRKNEVLFVRTPAGVDVAEAHPFFYEAQRRLAQSTITASFEEVQSLGDDLAGVTMSFTFLYSAGRSGSTVAGRIASRLPGVQAISEPDVFAHIATHRLVSSSEREAMLVNIARAVSRLFAANRAAVDPSRRHLLVKQRGMGVFGAELIHEAMPSARAIFLRRTPADVVDSYVGAFLHNPIFAFGRRIGLDRFAVRVFRRSVGFIHPWIPRFMPNVVSERAEGALRDGAVEVLALSVQAMTDEAVRLHATGRVPFACELQYEDLRRAPEAFARGLADGMGLPQAERRADSVAHALAAAKTDAQEGTSVRSRGASTLSAADVVRVSRVLATRSNSQVWAETGAV